MNEWQPSFGAIFYFFQNPADYRRLLRDVMLLWNPLWTNRFTRFSITGDTFRALPKSHSVNDVLTAYYDQHDFDRSLFFTIFDSPTNVTIGQQLLFWGGRIHEDFKLKTPNYLYVQIPPNAPFDVCRELFVKTCTMFPFHLGLGNYMVPCNPEGQPGSGSAACRNLRLSPFVLHEFETTFRNDSYLRLLEKRNAKFLAHPSQLIAIGSELSKFSNETIQLAKSCAEGVSVNRYDETSIIEFVSDIGIAKASTLFAPHFGDVQKPQMFWKMQEWNSWIERMRSESPGALVR